MLVKVTDARPSSTESTIDTTTRGPFLLDQFNLYRFWFSVRNVFFPMKSQLVDWKIELVDTQLWHISCNRSNRRVEIANRVFRDRNDLRTTLILATILTQQEKNDASTLRKDVLRVAQMATFIKHTDLATAIRTMHDALQHTEIEHAAEGMDLIQCRLPDDLVNTVEVPQSSRDMLFDDTLASSGINELLRLEKQEGSSSPGKINKAGKNSNAA